MTNFINNQEYLKLLINESSDNNIESSDNNIDSDSIIETDYDSFDDYDNKYYLEEQIQDNDKFTVSKRYYKYKSAIKIFYELLSFRNYDNYMTNIYKLNNQDYYIYQFKKQIKNFIITVILVDNFEIQNKNIILDNLDKKYFNNLVIFISCNGIFTKNENNEFAFLTIDKKIHIIDKLLENYTENINNNTYNNKYCIKYIFFNYNFKINNEIIN